MCMQVIIFIASCCLCVSVRAAVLHTGWDGRLPDDRPEPDGQVPSRGCKDVPRQVNTSHALFIVVLIDSPPTSSSRVAMVEHPCAVLEVAGLNPSEDRPKVLKWEERVHAGNTTYTTDNHPNSTKPRQGNNMNVNGYKTQKTHTNREKRWEYRLGTVSDKCHWWA